MRLNLVLFCGVGGAKGSDGFSPAVEASSAITNFVKMEREANSISMRSADVGRLPEGQLNFDQFLRIVNG